MHFMQMPSLNLFHSKLRDDHLSGAISLLKIKTNLLDSVGACVSASKHLLEKVSGWGGMSRVSSLTCLQGHFRLPTNASL